MVGLNLGEKLSPLRVSSNVLRRIEATLIFRPLVAGSALRLVIGGSATRFFNSSWR
jgi:hypothetical protein